MVTLVSSLRRLARCKRLSGAIVSGFTEIIAFSTRFGISFFLCTSLANWFLQSRGRQYCLHGRGDLCSRRGPLAVQSDRFGFSENWSFRAARRPVSEAGHDTETAHSVAELRLRAGLAGRGRALAWFAGSQWDILAWRGQAQLLHLL